MPKSKPSKKIPAITLKSSPINPPPKVSGLGRGLNALLGNAPAFPAVSALPSTQEQKTVDGKQILSVEITNIVPCPWQPRHIFREEPLADLVASIKAQGVISPLVCRKLPNNTFELIAGERRLRAATEAELKFVPVVVVEVDDRTAAEMALVENLQREDLNPIEEAEGYRALSDKFKITQQEIADRVGKPRATVANALRLLELSDDIKKMVMDSTLSAGHAKVLLGLDDINARHTLAQLAMKEGWSVRVLEQKVQRVNTAPQVHRTVTPDLPSDHLKLLTDKLHERFVTSCRLSPSVKYANGKRGKGRIEIDFMDNADLDRILPLLGIALDEI